MTFSSYQRFVVVIFTRIELISLLKRSTIVIWWTSVSKAKDLPRGRIPNLWRLSRPQPPMVSNLSSSGSTSTLLVMQFLSLLRRPLLGVSLILTSLKLPLFSSLSGDPYLDYLVLVNQPFQCSVQSHNKILVNFIRSILDDNLINLLQSSFILGRNTFDNILLYNNLSTQLLETRIRKVM